MLSTKKLCGFPVRVQQNPTNYWVGYKNNRKLLKRRIEGETSFCGPLSECPKSAVLQTLSATRAWAERFCGLLPARPLVSKSLFSSPSAPPVPGELENFLSASIMSSIQISLHDDIRKMTDSLGRFRADMRTKVVRRALTKVGRRANTEAVRAVRAEYKVPAKAVRNALSTRVTTDDAMEVALSLKGAPTPLADLNPRAYGGPSGWPTRGGKGKVRRPGGVTVKIKGKKYKIPHAFIATMSSGHVGVFARGGRSKVAAATGETYGSFSFSSQRLPITELFTFSLAQAFRNDKVLRKVVQRVTRDFSGLLAHEIEWKLGKMK